VATFASRALGTPPPSRGNGEGPRTRRAGKSVLPSEHGAPREPGLRSGRRSWFSKRGLVDESPSDVAAPGAPRPVAGRAGRERPVRGAGAVVRVRRDPLAAGAGRARPARRAAASRSCRSRSSSMAASRCSRALRSSSVIIRASPSKTVTRHRFMSPLRGQLMHSDENPRSLCGLPAAHWLPYPVSPVSGGSGAGSESNSEIASRGVTSRAGSGPRGLLNVADPRGRRLNHAHRDHRALGNIERLYRLAPPPIEQLARGEHARRRVTTGVPHHVHERGHCFARVTPRQPSHLNQAIRPAAGVRAVAGKPLAAGRS
jgi:hypothetical protein